MSKIIRFIARKIIQNLETRIVKLEALNQKLICENDKLKVQRLFPGESAITSTEIVFRSNNPKNQTNIYV